MLDQTSIGEIAYQREKARELAGVSRTPEFVIERYRRTRLWQLFPKEYMFKAVGDLRNKRVLDFGCGDGQIAVQMAALGAQVVGMDISPELIEVACRRAELDGVADRVQFLVGDIAEFPPMRATF